MKSRYSLIIIIYIQEIRIVQDVQKRKKKIETSDENVLFVLSERTIYGTILLVSETLPRLVPK